MPFHYTIIIVPFCFDPKKLSCVLAKKCLNFDKESNDSVGWYCSQLTHNQLICFQAQIFIYAWIGNETKFLLFLTIEESFLDRNIKCCDMQVCGADKPILQWSPGYHIILRHRIS